MAARRIVAMGGGTFEPPYDPRRDQWVLSLARRPRPRVAFVGTASGDDAGYSTRFFRAIGSLDCRPTDIPLFARRHGDLRATVLEQDVIYVGGGNTVSLLAVWRAHGLDEALREAYDAGVLLCGVSAGMNCWFEASTTDSLGAGKVAALRDGLGLLPGSACPHYDGEALRAPAFRRMVGEGELPDGWAADDAAALVFEEGDLAEVVCWEDSAAGYRVERESGERRIDARPL